MVKTELTKKSQPSTLRNLDSHLTLNWIGCDVGSEAGQMDHRHLLIHILNKSSLNAYHVLGAVLSTRKLHEQTGMCTLKKLTLYCKIMKVQRNQLGTHCNNPG